MPPGLFDNTPKNQLNNAPIKAHPFNTKHSTHAIPNQNVVVEEYLKKSASTTTMNTHQTEAVAVQKPSLVNNSPIIPPITQKSLEHDNPQSTTDNLKNDVSETINSLSAPKAMPFNERSNKPKDITLNSVNNTSKMTVEQLQTAMLKSKPIQPAQPSVFKSTALVGLQIVVLFIIVFGFVPPFLFINNTTLMMFGLFFVTSGVILASWTIISFNQKINIFPEPTIESLLVVDGPFKYVRHPMYSSLIILSLGIVAIYPTLVKICALSVLVLVLFYKALYEEDLLVKKFSGYSKYMTKTGRFFPKIKTITQKL